MPELRRVCVYAGSSPGTDPSYVDAAASLARLLAYRGIGIAYGGASVGLMGTLADAAMAAGGEVIATASTLTAALPNPVDRAACRPTGRPPRAALGTRVHVDLGARDARVPKHRLRAGRSFPDPA